MVSYATLKEQDAAREEWFASSDERIRQKEENEKKRKKQEKFHRDWWDLPPLPDESQEGNSQDGKGG